MPALDHLTVIAPNLAEGVAHVRDCLGVEAPFGRRHGHMGTHNHLLTLGGSVYLEIIAVDPEGPAPLGPRWFGLGDAASVRRHWDAGRRLRGWVARTDDIDGDLARHGASFGERHEFGSANGSFRFAIPPGGGLPMDGLAPSLIDRLGKTPSMPQGADQGCRLRSFRLQHPDVAAVERLYRSLEIENAPQVERADRYRYIAEIETPAGIRTLF